MVAPQGHVDTRSYDEILREINSAAEEGRLQQVKTLLPHLRFASRKTEGDLEGDLERLVQRSGALGHKTIVVYLLDHGATLQPWMPVMMFYYWGGDHFNMIPIIQEFIDRGWDVNTVTPQMGTLLYRALLKENVPLINWLISKGADINIPQNRTREGRQRPIGTAFGTRPLDIAAQCCSLDIIQKLLDSGARVEECNALHKIASSHHTHDRHFPILDFFLGKGMDINAIEKPEENPGIGFNWLTGTPLHYAAIWNHQRMVKAFLERGADPTVEASLGYGNALDWALDPNGEPDSEVIAMLTEAVKLHRERKNE